MQLKIKNDETRKKLTAKMPIAIGETHERAKKKSKKYNWPSDPKRKYKQFRNWRYFWANVKKIKRETHIESTTEHNHA